MPNLQIRITSDSSAARKDIDGFSDLMGRAAVPAAVVGGAMLAMAGDAVAAASDAQQAAGALEAVFGDATAAMAANAEDAAQAVGLAESDYSQLAAVMGAQLGNMGIAQDELAGTTDGLITKGADLAAQFGGSTSDAVAALSSLMRGERDPIEKYGVSISAAAVESEKAKLGLDGLTGAADKAATTQATLSLLNQQTASSTGAFAREANTAAGAQQIATASTENAAATLGTVLLPVVAAGSAALADFAGWVQNNSTVVTILAGVVLAITGAVLAFNAGMAIGRAAIGLATAAQWLFNAALSANPLGLIIIAIVAVIAAIVLLVRNWDTVKRVALDVWKAISAAVGTAATWLETQWSAAVSKVSGFFSNLGRDAKRAVDDIIGWFAGIPGRVTGFFNNIKIPGWIGDALGFLGLSAPAAASLAASAPGPAAFAAGAALYSPARSITPAGLGGTVVQINVNGALDPRAVAKQIRDLLNTDARLRGAVSLSGVVIP